MSNVSVLDTQAEIKASLSIDVRQDWNLVRGIIVSSQESVRLGVLCNLKHSLCGVKRLNLVVLA